MFARGAAARDLAAAFCGAAEGDAVTEVNALDAWRAAKAAGGAGGAWAAARGLTLRGLRAAGEARRDVLHALRAVADAAAAADARAWRVNDDAAPAVSVASERGGGRASWERGDPRRDIGRRRGALRPEKSSS